MGNKLGHHLLIYSTSIQTQHIGLLKPNWTIAPNASLLAIFQGGNSASEFTISDQQDYKPSWFNQQDYGPSWFTGQPLLQPCSIQIGIQIAPDACLLYLLHAYSLLKVKMHNRNPQTLCYWNWNIEAFFSDGNASRFSSDHTLDPQKKQTQNNPTINPSTNQKGSLSIHSFFFMTCIQHDSPPALAATICHSDRT